MKTIKVKIEFYCDVKAKSEDGAIDAMLSICDDNLYKEIEDNYRNVYLSIDTYDGPVDVKFDKVNIEICRK